MTLIRKGKWRIIQFRERNCDGGHDDHGGHSHQDGHDDRFDDE